jgi:hypothetical protein
MSVTDVSDRQGSEVRELASASRALVTALDTIEATAVRQPDLDLLAEAVPGCVRLSGLLAALAGCLSELAHGLADASQVRVIDDVAGQSTGNALADIAVELDLMRTLLHRATLAAAPALAGLRRIPHRVDL